MKRLFFGGIHPSYRKELSAKATPSVAVIPKQVVIPMQQHIGIPCTPLVKVGDKVLRGQKIGDGEGLCVPVHASVSGTVTAVEPRPHPSGRMVMAVVIDNDFRDTTIPARTPDVPTDQMDADTVLSRIREAGIVGMGGAAFPGNVKALSAMGKVDTLIANACECEPYITADDTLLRTNPEQVLRGMTILRRVLGATRTVLAVEDNKQEAISKVNGILPDYPGIEISVLPTRYPQGAEKQLIQALTGRQVPPGGLPSAVGCAVFNAATFAAVYKAVFLGEPVTRRIVTVTGEAVKQPKNMIARMGTSFAELVEAAGGLTDDVWKVLSGGPMMGVAQVDLEAPVVKGTNAILCLSNAQNGEGRRSIPCIRCGKCVGVCPMRLQPLNLYRYEQAGDLEALDRLHLTDCIECGCCAYTCPSKLPLVEHFRLGKRALKEGKK
ncbi:MAG: electron transport complex subunit RsxC [Firmicutes bacterium]|nr:electron transport complex subunit RsxC [Bacillota bacterium]